MILDQIRGEVWMACQQAGNVLTPGFYDAHLALVARYGLELADTLGADREIVELAAWLHDISAVLDFTTLPEHAEASARRAATMLADHGYPDARVAAVADAVRRHTRPLQLAEGTPEEVALSNADAMAQIAAPEYWLYFAFRIRNLGYAEGRAWYEAMMRRNWEAIVPQARAILEPRYREVLRLFES